MKKTKPGKFEELALLAIVVMQDEDYGVCPAFIRMEQMGFENVLGIFS